ncbi:MAG: LamG domain-containing protein, partial [Candidatus Nanohalobium sp.]
MSLSEVFLTLLGKYRCKEVIVVLLLLPILMAQQEPSVGAATVGQRSVSTSSSQVSVLRSYYRFDRPDEFSDSSGEGNQLSYSSGSLYFDGSDDYIEAGSLHNDIESTFTLAQWVRPRPGGRYFINSAHDWIDPDGDGNSDVRGYWLELRDTEGQLNFVIGNGTKTVSLSTTSDWQYNEWSHVAASVSTGKMKLFLDGEKVAEKSIDLEFIQRDTPTYLSSHHAGSLPLNGSLSDLRVYNTSLNESQVEKVYRRSFEEKKDLVAWWRYGENNGNVPDLIGNNTGVWRSQSTERVYSFENVSGATASDLSTNSDDSSLQNVLTANLEGIN